jgi:GntR family transcriptional regulator
MDYPKLDYQAKHRQIIEALNREIEQGSLKPYNRLPSEKELCQRWQTSRGTVRKAMDHLTDRGKIFRVPGKGSFVAFSKISHPTSQLLSFSEKMKAQGLSVETKLIRKEVVEPDEEVAASLRLGRRDRVLKIQRLRIVQGNPLALQTSFIPVSLCEKLLDEDLASKSLNQLMQEKCNISLSRSDVWVEAAILSRKEQRWLGNPKVPLFLAIVGLTYDQSGLPVRISRGIFRGDRVKLKITDTNRFEFDYSGHSLDGLISETKGSDGTKAQSLFG